MKKFKLIVYTNGNFDTPYREEVYNDKQTALDSTATYIDAKCIIREV